MRATAWSCPACGSKLGVKDTLTSEGRVTRERRCVNRACDNRSAFRTVEVSEELLKQLSRIDAAVETYQRTLNAGVLRKFTDQFADLFPNRGKRSTALGTGADNEPHE